MHSPPPTFTMPHHTKKTQRGAALMVMLVIVVMAMAAALVSSLSSSAQKSARQQKTAAALAQAKEALIGRAISDDNRPGSLPCPDINDDGVVDGVAGNCTSYIGRFPWKTLELPDIGDGDGERLWYVLSPSFKDNPSSEPLNSVPPNLWADPLTLGAETNVVAIIFAPGVPLSGQNGRPSNNIADHMEGENAGSDAIYATGLASESFNDHALSITRANLMGAVEKRVVAEARKLLTGFYANSSSVAASRYFPYAATLGTNSPTIGLRRGLLPVSCRFLRSGATPNFAYTCNSSRTVDLINRSNFKFTAATGTCVSTGFPDRCQCSVGVGTCIGERINTGIAAEVRSLISLDAMQIAGNGKLTPTPADWFMDNQWERMIFFAVADGCTAAAPGCSSGTMLSTSHQADLAAVVISTGIPLASTETKTTPQSGYPSAAVDDYLDSEENINNDEVFSMLGKARTPVYNDIVIAIPRGSL